MKRCIFQVRGNLATWSKASVNLQLLLSVDLANGREAPADWNVSKQVFPRLGATPGDVNLAAILQRLRLTELHILLQLTTLQEVFMHENQNLLT
jgi:hypothetical protein